MPSKTNRGFKILRRNYFKLRLLRFVVIPICDFAKKKLSRVFKFRMWLQYIKADRGINITADLENRLLTFIKYFIFFKRNQKT